MFPIPPLSIFYLPTSLPTYLLNYQPEDIGSNPVYLPEDTGSSPDYLNCSHPVQTTTPSVPSPFNQQPSNPITYNFSPGSGTDHPRTALKTLKNLPGLELGVRDVQEEQVDTPGRANAKLEVQINLAQVHNLSIFLSSAESVGMDKSMNSSSQLWGAMNKSQNIIIETCCHCCYSDEDSKCTVTCCGSIVNYGLGHNHK